LARHAAARRILDYVRYLMHTGVRDSRATTGNRGVIVLRRDHGAEANFLFTSFWDSLEAARGFAGADLDRARYYPRDHEFLVALEPRVAHYEVVDLAGPDRAAHVGRILKPLA
jgi:heme-degrading monooxygenase HmoA